MGQASKSHQDDALGGKSKASQKPQPANVGHANHHPNQEADGIHNGIPTEKNRAPETAKVAPAGRTQRALAAGHHGKQTDAEGNNNAVAKKHPLTKGY